MHTTSLGCQILVHSHTCTQLEQLGSRLLSLVTGIVLSKAKLPMFPTFVALSAGYLLASRREVDSVELPYLNRARLSYTTRQFLSTGGWLAARCCGAAGAALCLPIITHTEGLCHHLNA